MLSKMVLHDCKRLLLTIIVLFNRTSIAISKLTLKTTSLTHSCFFYRNSGGIEMKLLLQMFHKTQIKKIAIKKIIVHLLFNDFQSN